MLYQRYLNIQKSELSDFLKAFIKFKHNNKANHLILKSINKKDLESVINYDCHAITNSEKLKDSYENSKEYFDSLNWQDLKKYLVHKPEIIEKVDLTQGYEYACLQKLQAAGLEVDSIKESNDYIRCGIIGKKHNNKSGAYIYSSNKNLNFINYVSMSAAENYSIKDFINDKKSEIGYENKKFTQEEKREWAIKKYQDDIYNMQLKHNAAFAKYQQEKLINAKLKYIVGKIHHNDNPNNQIPDNSQFSAEELIKLNTFANSLQPVVGFSNEDLIPEYLIKKKIDLGHFHSLAFIATNDIKNLNDEEGYFAKKGNLILPIYNLHTRELQGLQSIGNGKYYLKNSNINLGVIPIKSSVTNNVTTVNLDKAQKIFLTEGYATGVSIRGALDFAEIYDHNFGKDALVLSSFSALNLKQVAIELSKKYPKKQIIIAGDNDLRTQLKHDAKLNMNTGIRVFLELKKLGLRNISAAFPKFDITQANNGNSDWNDYFILHGYGDLIKSPYKKEELKSKEFIDFLATSFNQSNEIKNDLALSFN